MREVRPHVFPCQAPIGKVAGISSIVWTKKATTFECFSKFSGLDEKHFYSTNLKPVYYFRGKSYFFGQS